MVYLFTFWKYSFIYLIYLAALGLSCGMRDLSMWHMDALAAALGFSCSNGTWVHWASPYLEFSWRSANWPRRTSFRMLDYLGWLPVAHSPTRGTEHPSRWLTEEGKSGRGNVQVLYQAHVGTAVANIPLVKKVTWSNSGSQVGKALPPGRRKFKVTLQKVWMPRGKKIRGHPPLGLNKWSSDKEGVRFFSFTCWCNWENTLFMSLKKVQQKDT